jgi:hypothetical protein
VVSTRALSGAEALWFGGPPEQLLAALGESLTKEI